VQTFVSDPRSRSAQSGIQTGFTHTLAKPCVRASWHSVSIWSRVASGFSSVWSMRRAISRG
jgi:hypothetical protein